MYFVKGVSYQDADFGHHADIDVDNLGDLYDVSDIGSDCEKSYGF